MTGTDVIVAALKRHPMTAGEMLALRVSVCPWRRAAEWLERNPRWKLRKGSATFGRAALTTWRIVRAR